MMSGLLQYYIGGESEENGHVGAFGVEVAIRMSRVQVRDEGDIGTWEGEEGVVVLGAPVAKSGGGGVGESEGGDIVEHGAGVALCLNKASESRGCGSA
jgi:hypothetical protein